VFLVARFTSAVCRLSSAFSSLWLAKRCEDYINILL
jgi:hypothetical protein